MPREPVAGRLRIMLRGRLCTRNGTGRRHKMRTKQGLRIAGVAAAGLAALLLAGCRVESDKHGDRNSDR